VKSGLVRLTESSDTHIGLAFPGVSIASPDHASVEVLVEVLKNNLLSSLSHSWLKSLDVTHFSYEDTGLIVVYAHANAGHGYELSSALYNAIKKISRPSQNDTQSAKKRVKLELTKYGAVDRNYLVQHLATVGTSLSDFLSAVDSADFSKISNSLQTSPVVVALGDVRGIQKY